MINKHFFFSFCAFLMIGFPMHILAQKTASELEGTGYYLPLTKINFVILSEKTTYTPGDFSIYAEKYLKLSGVSSKPSVTYRLININSYCEAERDTSKSYVAPTDAKHNIQTLDFNNSGTLAAINTDAKKTEKPKSFTPSAKAKELNPREYMSEEILSSGSSAKMAELCAAEIYDIRESKSLLSKGQAEFMPNDGEQLRIMLKELDTKEAALMQLFTGVTQKDTIETTIDFIPSKLLPKNLLFRFSKWMGFTDDDDLGGRPFFVGVEDLGITQQIQDNLLNINKKSIEDYGIFVNVPGKIKVSLYDGNNLFSSTEVYAAQFGRVEALNEDLFGKKYFTTVRLDPVTGSLEDIQTDSVKK